MFRAILMLLLLASAGFASTLTAEAQTPTPSETPTPISSPTAPSSILPSAGSGTATSPPSGVLPTATPSPTGGVPAATTPTAGARAGWNAFVSPALHVALEYPATWTLREEPMGILFTPPQGAAIQLGKVDTGSLTPEQYLANSSDVPNTRCTQTINPYGVTVRSCFDTIASSLVATFSLRSQTGGAQLLALATNRRRVDIQVWDQIIASLHPAP